MVVVTDCETLTIKDNLIFRLKKYKIKKMWSCHVSGSYPDTGRRVMLQNLSLHAKMGISKCSC